MKYLLCLSTIFLFLSACKKQETRYELSYKGSDYDNKLPELLQDTSLFLNLFDREKMNETDMPFSAQRKIGLRLLATNSDPYPTTKAEAKSEYQGIETAVTIADAWPLTYWLCQRKKGESQWKYAKLPLDYRFHITDTTAFTYDPKQKILFTFSLHQKQSQEGELLTKQFSVPKVERILPSNLQNHQLYYMENENTLKILDLSSGETLHTYSVPANAIPANLIKSSFELSVFDDSLLISRESIWNIKQQKMVFHIKADEKTEGHLHLFGASGDTLYLLQAIDEYKYHKIDDFRDFCTFFTLSRSTGKSLLPQISLKRIDTDRALDYHFYAAKKWLFWYSSLHDAYLLLDTKNATLYKVKKPENVSFWRADKNNMYFTQKGRFSKNKYLIQQPIETLMERAEKMKL